MKTTTQLRKFSDDILYAELHRRRAKTKELERKALKLNGFTVKDVVVQYGVYEESYKDIINYMFYLKVGNGLYDFYYDSAVAPRWPDVKGDDKGNNVLKFVPDEFAEAAKNLYEYSPDLKNSKAAIECLKRNGITDVRVYDGEYLR